MPWAFCPCWPHYTGETGATGASGETGATGVTGNTGAPGFVASGFPYLADTGSQVGTGIAAGDLRWNNVTQTSATELFIAHEDGNSTDWSAFFDLINDGDQIRIQDRDDAAKYQLFDVTADSVDNTTYHTFTVTLIQSVGAAFSDNEEIVVIFNRDGDIGPTGPTGGTGATGETGSTGQTGPGVATLNKSITWESPTATDDLDIWYTSAAVTITAVEGVLANGTSTPSVTVDLKHHTDRSNVGNDVFAAPRAVTSTTTGDNLTLGGDVTIPANSFVWVETTAQSGTVPIISLTITFTED